MDHPRSRGVYASGAPTASHGDGSSPLARGLLDDVRPQPLGRGIIPARAGFTGGCTWAGGRARDHPRSRGVYAARRWQARRHRGSSPLARGLRPSSNLPHRRGRIIPARAGFTHGPRAPGFNRADHPRSRGVYVDGGTDNDPLDGSSPLARGLRAVSGPQREKIGIIPARAGFTPAPGPPPWWSWDHPRSRGVYVPHGVTIEPGSGSSPLARGLHLVPVGRVDSKGIIPARAGFTRPGR